MNKILLILLILFNINLFSYEEVLNKNKKANKLVNESSPYLLQHAYNPVEWYPWSDEAFNLANKENKPIFLSIGYSTCHWCHVMEEESFENQEIAKLLNESFVCVKVDREERPDIDNIYMTVCQILTGSGGWPLTIIMTPDKKPFFAGTYFPPKSIYGRIGLSELIPKIDSIWKNDKETIYENADEISNALKTASISTSKGEFNKSILDSAFIEFENLYDEQFGGFGQSPKFPTPHQLNFLLRYHLTNGNEKSLEMVENTLTNMRYGGIFDHVGYGFHRYSTDRQWLLPHFEKMLYDQANLISVFSELYTITKNKFYLNTAKEIFEYVKRELYTEKGSFYSAEDADSEGVEGKFYVWEKSEIKEILKDNSELYSKVYNIYSNGNYTEEAQGHGAGGNIPHLKNSLEYTSNELNISEEELKAKLSDLNFKLLNERDKRIHPFKDKKILTDWNSLMISAICDLVIASNDYNYLEFAINCEKFINENLTDENEIYHLKTDNKSITGFIDDNAFYIESLLKLYYLTYDISYIKKAVKFTDITVEKFYSEENKAFYFAKEDSEDLLVRKIEFYDGAVPSGNSVMLNNLIQLNKITANNKYSEIADNMLNSFYNLAIKSPTSFSEYLISAQFVSNVSYEIVIVGQKTDKNIKLVNSAIYDLFRPNKVVIWKEDDEDEITKIAEYSKMMYVVNDKLTIYLCKNYSCENPTNDLNLIKNYLENQIGK